MMSTPPSSQKKRKSKRQSIESPGINKSQGHQWVPLPQATHLLVPSNKIDSHLTAANSAKDLYNVLSESECATLWPSGVVDSNTYTLYARATGLDKIEINDHLPLRSNSIFIHPDTMKCCGLVIASPVVVRNSHHHQQQEGKQQLAVICRVWPLMRLPLDVVALGTTSMLSCCAVEACGLEICALGSLSRVPVAGELEVEPCEKLDFPINQTFTSYLLHMHDGHFVSNDNIISVVYYGDNRTFKIVAIQPLEDVPPSATRVTTIEPTAASTEEAEVVKRMSELTVASEETEKSSKSGSSFQVFKITSRSKMKIVEKTQEKTEMNGRPNLSNVGGLEKQVELLKELILYPLENMNVKGLKFPRGVLLHGPPGVGKSLLAQALAQETLAHCIMLSVTELLLGSHDTNTEGAMQLAFKEAREKAPSLLLLDDLHLLCPHRNSSPSENERRVTASLSSCLDDLNRHPPPAHVVVIATTNQIEGVEPTLRRPGKFDYEIEIPVPTAVERRQILNLLLSSIEHCVSSEGITQIADSAHGHVGADLSAVCLEAQHLALHRTLVKGGECEAVKGDGVMVCVSDLQQALRKIRPSAMREVAVEVPKVHWSDIGGEEEVKQRMREAVEWPLKHPEAFVRLGISPPKGVLLYGPPGCSKTMIARALATESGLNFIAVKGPELFSKWVGDSERAVRQVFSRARAAAPSIIFFDEIDALAVQRKSEGGGGSSVADRVLAQLLTEMDGVETLNDVLIVAATNRPDMIDKALLRPGRIDRLVYVPLPFINTRREIFEIQFKKMSVDSEVDIDTLVQHTAGFSGAEVVTVCQEAALCAMHEDINIEKVHQRHFEQALKTIHPQTDPNMIQFYEKYSRSYAYLGN